MRKEDDGQKRNRKLLVEAWSAGFAMAAMYLLALKMLLTGTIG
ncbi:hypothetical protein [Novosphingobium pentaromativorans]|nr:hypothetical protein [Novosphingobium pentaromativorans]